MGPPLSKTETKYNPCPMEKNQFIHEHFQKKPRTEREKYCKKRSKADLTLRHLQN